MTFMGFWVYAKRVGGASVGNMIIALYRPSTRTSRSYETLYTAHFEPFRNFFGVPLRGSSDIVHCWSKCRFEAPDGYLPAYLEDPTLNVWFKVFGGREVEFNFVPGSTYPRVRGTVVVSTYKPPQPGRSNYFDYQGPLDKIYYSDSGEGAYQFSEIWLGATTGRGWLRALAGRNSITTRDYIDTLIRATMFEEW